MDSKTKFIKTIIMLYSGIKVKAHFVFDSFSFFNFNF